MKLCAMAFLSWLFLIGLAALVDLRAELAPGLGYSRQTLYLTTNFQFIGGLESRGAEAYFGVGTNVLALSLSSGVAQLRGTLPAPNTGASYLRWHQGRLNLSFAQNFAFPPACRIGELDAGGNFWDQAGLSGVFDAAVNAQGDLYLVAMPSMAGTKIFRYTPATTTLVEVAFIGGFSGGIAFDSSNRLYVAEQNHGRIVRFTPAQLTAGNLTVNDGQTVLWITAGYLCFDPYDRLYATTGYGNELAMYDVERGQKLRTLATDTDGEFGIGWIQWNRALSQLLVVYSDYYHTMGSTLYALTFARSTDGIAGTSTVFRSWIAATRDVTRPDTNSGGYTRGALTGYPGGFNLDEQDEPSHVRSLGNGGSIILEFEDAIANGPGPDFAVFENGFDAGDFTFSELAFVEVATTTNAWARFPATAFVTNALGPFGIMDVTKVDGFAGKHTLEYGTPFDLDWLAHHPNVTNGLVDLSRIAFVRLVDVVGNGSTFDQFGKPIYDPHGVLASATDGFDLRGVGVIHTAGLKIINEENEPVVAWQGYRDRAYQLQTYAGGVWQDHGGALAGTDGVHRVSVPAGIMFRVQKTIPPPAP